MFMPEVEMERSYRRALSVFTDDIDYEFGGVGDPSRLYFESAGRSFVLEFNAKASPEILTVQTKRGLHYGNAFELKPATINRFNACHPCVKAYIELRHGLILSSDHQIAGKNLIPSEEVIQAVLIDTVDRLSRAVRFFERQLDLD